MAFPALFDALKLHLKARGLTYADVAAALALSEASIKRIFSTRDCSLERFASLCALVEVDIAELARAAPRQPRLLNVLSWAQEEELVADEKLLLIAICVLNQMRWADILAIYLFSAADLLALLLRLEHLGIVEVHENNRIRLCVSRTFAWIADGPIMRYVRQQMGEYFDHPFTLPGEVMRIVNVRLSRPASAALLSRLEQLAREYSEQHAADSVLPLDERPVLSVCLAVRHWEPRRFERWLRPA